jgi:sRNA-binding protein
LLFQTGQPVCRYTPALVEHAEKQREKERRAVAREEKVEQEKAIQSERAARSLERSQAPVHRKTGKPMMSRSVPPSRKKKEEIVKTNTEEEELKEFLSTDF